MSTARDQLQKKAFALLSRIANANGIKRVNTKKPIATPLDGFLLRWTRIENTPLCAEACLDNKAWLSPFQQRDSNARSTAARLGAPHSRGPNRISSACRGAAPWSTRGISSARSEGITRRRWATKLGFEFLDQLPDVFDRPRCQYLRDEQLVGGLCKFDWNCHSGGLNQNGSLRISN
jgi:hypothetical protein